uniref:Uncharacterized protein n=1 Tax=Cacopsylla melanoneura TaxID=428564 RepID=A0A8D9BFP3_9HEMI
MSQTPGPADSQRSLRPRLQNRDERFWRPRYTVSSSSDDDVNETQLRNSGHRSVGTRRPRRTLLNDTSTFPNISHILDDESSGTSSHSSTPRTTRANVTRIFRRTPDTTTVVSPSSTLTGTSQPSQQRHTGRMRWSKELNFKLLHAYFESTELDNNRKNYIKRLETIWNAQSTNPNIDGNKLATRVRYILNNKIYSEPEI